MGSFVDEQIVTTLENYSPVLRDNVTNHNALLYKLKSTGNIETVSGGNVLEEDLMYAENDTHQWYRGLEVLDISQNPVLEPAQFQWKQSAVNVVISGLEERVNAGSKERKHALLKSRIMVAEKTMQNKTNTSLFSDGTGSSGKELGGLQLLVADDPTSGVVGGIDRATNTYWRNQVYDFSANGVSGTPTGAEMIAAMDEMDLLTQRGADRTKLILADKTYYNIYRAYCQSIKRIFNNNELGDAGFKAIDYDGVPVVYDPACPAGHMYFLNTDYLKFKVHKDANFAPLAKRTPTQQDGNIYPIIFQGNLVVSNSSLQGVIHA